jgi:hypothetical protein
MTGQATDTFYDAQSLFAALVTPGYLRYVWPVVLALLGLNWLGQPSGSWRHILSLCFLVLSIPVGVILACVAHRFSVVEGLAGDVGYEDLDAKQDDKPPA